MNDPVNHPRHYADGWSNGAEVIDITENLSFNRGNAVKYAARAGKKDPELELQDLEKAAWYLDREIELVRRQWDKTPAYNVVPVDESFWLDIDEDLCRKEARKLLVPRVWVELADVPHGVRVLDSYGAVWVHKLGRWGWIDGDDWLDIIDSESWGDEGPFTEVLA